MARVGRAGCAVCGGPGECVGGTGGDAAEEQQGADAASAPAGGTAAPTRAAKRRAQRRRAAPAASASAGASGAAEPGEAADKPDRYINSGAPPALTKTEAQEPGEPGVSAAEAARSEAEASIARLRSLASFTEDEETRRLFLAEALAQEAALAGRVPALPLTVGVSGPQLTPGELALPPGASTGLPT